jgi:formate dehydrogenase accessory protein FdhE
MKYSWDERVARAHQLAVANEDARLLLSIYARLLELQRDATHQLARVALSGSIEQDLHALRAVAVPMFAGADVCPPTVVTAMYRLRDSRDDDFAAALLEAWVTPGSDFAPRFVLQPYAEQLAARGIAPLARRDSHAGPSCPFCAGPPQLSILHAETAAEGGGRLLQCAMCSTTWSFGRVRCAYCGEEDEHQLGYYSASGLDHVRVDACDTCRHYLKAVDLTRLGTAVPVVDEIAACALDVWAVEHGYCKIELSLVGT